MNGKAKNIYMNKEVEKKALEVCERHKVSMSTLIRLALEKYIAEVEVKEAR